MSNVIDQKVVEMKFDNKNFESNVQTSLSTLDKLKRGLNLSGAAKGLDDVGSAAKRIDFSGIGSAVESVSSKFSALGIMGVTALVNITNSAVNAGKRIVSALTIDPVKTGLQEYETQINAIQTILANTAHNGTTLDEVNDALDELNKYADLTIYNFTEMTKNIGTFTAAGLDLDTSVKGIQGIANLAAVSGSTSHQASTAMYQLSQAMAAGTVTLQDWNSVVNASMGGKVFQDAIIQTAKDIGMESEAVQAAVEAYEDGANFRSILNAQDNDPWLTSDILVAALSKFTKTGAVEYLSDLYDVSASSIEELQKLGDTTGYNTDEFDKMVSTLSKGDEAMAENIKNVLSMANTATAAATEVKTLSQLWDTLKETAQSGWTQTWELIVGDFEEAKTLLSGVYNTLSPILEASAAARNELLQGWKDAGGRDDMIQSFRNIYEAIKSIVNPIREAFSEIFPPTTAKQLANVTKVIKNLTEKFILSEKASDNLKRTFKGLFAVLDIVKQGFTVAFAAIKPWLSGLDNLGGGILSVTAKIGDWLVSLRDGTKKLDAFSVATNSFAAKNKLINTIKSIVEWFKELGRVVNTKFVAPGLEGLKNLLDRIKERMTNLSETADMVKTAVSNAFKAIGDSISNAFSKIDFFNLLGTLWDGLTTLGKGAVKAVSALAKGLSGIFEGASFSGFFDIVNTLIAGGVGAGIIKFLQSATDTISSFKDIANGVVDIFDGLRGCLEAYQTQLKAETLKKIATAIAILVGSLLVVSLIDSEKLSKAVGAITMLFGGLVGSMAALDKMGTSVTGVGKLVSAMIGMSIAVLILAGALKKVSDIDSEKLGQALLGIMSLAMILLGAFKQLGNGSGDATVMKGATQMIIFAVAIKILASAAKDLGALRWEELAKGLIGVAALMAAVVLFINKTNFSNISMSSVIAVVIFAAAIKILASAVKDLSVLSWEELAKGLIGVGALIAAIGVFLTKTTFSKDVLPAAIGILAIAAALKIIASAAQDFASMSWDELQKGLIGIGGLLLLLAAFVNVTGKAQNVIATGIGLIAIGAAMKIFASAVKDLGALSWEELAKGIIGMAAALAAVTVALNFMPSGVDVLATGAGLILVSAALLILASALKSMGSMSWDELSVAIVALGGSLLILAMALDVMNGSIAGAAALLIASAALAVLAPSLKTLGGMSWEEIAKGLIVLAGAFAIMGVAGAVLGPLVPTILGLAGSFALIGLAVLGIGAGLLAAGAGLSALAVGFTALATAGAAGATALVAAITIIITGLIALIPAILLQVGDIIVAICKVVTESAPAIAEAIKAVVLSLVDVLVTCVPAIADGALKLVVGVLEALVEYGPRIIELVFQFVIDVINGFAEKLPDLIKAVVNLFTSFFAGVVDALKGVDVSVMLEAIVGVGLISAIMAALSAVAGLIPGAMIGVLGIGAVIAEIALVLAAIGALAQIPGLDWLIGEGGELLQSIGNAIGKFIGGIAGGVAEGFTSSLPQIGNDLSDFMTNITPFVEGAKQIDPSVLSGVRAIADVILLLTAANILDGLTSWLTGGSALDKFGAQLPTLGTNLSQFASNLGTFGSAQIETVTCAANAVKEMAEAADLIPNSGGWVAKLVGDNSIAAFSSELPALGLNLRVFALNLGTFGEAQIESISCAANAIKEMANASTNIKGQAGWAKALFGDNSIAKFSSEMPELGSNLNGFITNLGTFGSGQIATTSSAVKAINALATLADSDLKGAKKNLEGFGDKIVQLAKDIASFVSGMPATSNLDSAIANVSKILKMIGDISGADANIATNFTKSLKNIGKDGVKAFVEAFTSSSAKADVKKAAVELIEEVAKGAESKLDAIKKAFKELATAGKDAIRDKRQDFYNAGSYLVSGFASGISENSYKAEAQARAMALAAKRAAEAALDINSPSKVFYQIGSYSGEGFVNALTDYSDKAYSASSRMANSARQGLQNSISSIRDAIESDIDSQPTIRPVLDLSDVQSGASAISGMFNSRASLGVLANVGSISTMMNRNSQNGRNSDVVSAIDKLNKNLGGNTGNSYTINGITYDDGSNVSQAVKELVKAARVERRR